MMMMDFTISPQNIISVVNKSGRACSTHGIGNVRGRDHLGDQLLKDSGTWNYIEYRLGGVLCNTAKSELNTRLNEVILY